MSQHATLLGRTVEEKGQGTALDKQDCDRVAMLFNFKVGQVLDKEKLCQIEEIPEKVFKTSRA